MNKLLIAAVILFMLAVFFFGCAHEPPLECECFNSKRGMYEQCECDETKIYQKLQTYYSGVHP